VRKKDGNSHESRGNAMEIVIFQLYLLEREWKTEGESVGMRKWQFQLSFCV